VSPVEHRRKVGLLRLIAEGLAWKASTRCYELSMLCMRPLLRECRWPMAYWWLSDLFDSAAFRLSIVARIMGGSDRERARLDANTARNRAQHQARLRIWRGQP
jgi:hypothetical protein